MNCVKCLEAEAIFLVKSPINQYEICGKCAKVFEQELVEEWSMDPIEEEDSSCWSCSEEYLKNPDILWIKRLGVVFIFDKYDLERFQTFKSYFYDYEDAIRRLISYPRNGFNFCCLSSSGGSGTMKGVTQLAVRTKMTDKEILDSIENIQKRYDEYVGVFLKDIDLAQNKLKESMKEEKK